MSLKLEKKSYHYQNNFLCVDSVYCAVKIKNTSYTGIFGLFADFAGIIAAILMTYFFYY